MDHLISTLQACAKASVRIPITVISGGYFITGTPISAKEFVDNVNKEVGTALTATDNRNSAVADAFRKFTNLYAVESASDDAYLHLRDANVIMPDHNPVPGGKGMWLRLTVSSISTITFGAMTQ